MRRERPTTAIVRVVVAFFLFAALAPVWLGPALAPLNAAADAATHVCACGMKPGTCGCPECAQLERDRHDQFRSHRYSIKRTCDDDLFVGGSLSPFLLADASWTARRFAASVAQHDLVSTKWSNEGVPPPTPPPRS